MLSVKGRGGGMRVQKSIEGGGGMAWWHTDGNIKLRPALIVLALMLKKECYINILEQRKIKT